MGTVRALVYAGIGAVLAGAATAAAAGAQWVPVTSGTTAELRGLSVVGSRVVWASGTGGRVVRSTDAGATWRVDSVAGASGLDLRAIHAASASEAWAISAGPAEEGQARIFETRDGGGHWTLRWSTDAKGVFIDAIAFWDARHGIVLGDPVDGRIFVLATDDAGRTWKRLPPDAPAMLPGEAAFAASGSCLVVEGPRRAWIGTGGGATARVLRSLDRGRSWRAVEAPVRAGGASAGIFSLAFRDARHGVAVGGDYREAHEGGANVAVTRDGGRSWSAARGPLPPAYLSGVAYATGAGAQPSATLVAVGLAGTALSTDDGQRWRMVDSVAYNSVRFAGGVGFAAGPAGRIARWEADGGR
jgi:photosystem II stability/assembly factor-like uncharacterized protein